MIFISSCSFPHQKLAVAKAFHRVEFPAWWTLLSNCVWRGSCRGDKWSGHKPIFSSTNRALAQIIMSLMYPSWANQPNVALLCQSFGKRRSLAVLSFDAKRIWQRVIHPPTARCRLHKAFDRWCVWDRFTRALRPFGDGSTRQTLLGQRLASRPHD